MLQWGYPGSCSSLVYSYLKQQNHLQIENKRVKFQLWRFLNKGDSEWYLYIQVFQLPNTCGCYHPATNIPHVSRVGGWHDADSSPLDKMAAISQTIFWGAFSWMKSLVSSILKFHWSLCPRVWLIITSIGSDNGLVPNRRQAIIWINACPIQ